MVYSSDKIKEKAWSCEIILRNPEINGISAEEDAIK